HSTTGVNLGRRSQALAGQRRGVRTRGVSGPTAGSTNALSRLQPVKTPHRCGTPQNADRTRTMSVDGHARGLGFRTMPAHPRTITEPSREIDVIHETDVLVVGSGPGGLAAALAASRAGVRVALVERFGCFGGNITTVGVEGFAWYRHEQTVDAGGIGWEFEQRAKNMGAAVPESQSLSYELDSEG